jgi:hypothetical protein
VGLRFGVVPSPEWKVGEWEVGGEPEGFGKCQGACELFFFGDRERLRTGEEGGDGGQAAAVFAARFSV